MLKSGIRLRVMGRTTEAEKKNQWRFESQNICENFHANFMCSSHKV